LLGEESAETFCRKYQKLAVPHLADQQGEEAVDIDFRQIKFGRLWRYEEKRYAG
jgi:hypothetical protein